MVMRVSPFGKTSTLAGSNGILAPSDDLRLGFVCVVGDVVVDVVVVVVGVGDDDSAANDAAFCSLDVILVNRPNGSTSNRSPLAYLYEM